MSSAENFTQSAKRENYFLLRLNPRCIFTGWTEYNIIKINAYYICVILVLECLDREVKCIYLFQKKRVFEKRFIFNADVDQTFFCTG